MQTFYLNKTLPYIAQRNIITLCQCTRCAKRETGRGKSAPNASLRDYLIQKGQALVDENHDKSEHFTSAQVGPRKWIAWILDAIAYDKEITYLLMLYVS